MTWTVTATAQPSNVPPRVSVTVTTTDSTTSCTVMRNNADGTQGATRTTTGSVLQLPGGTGQFYDYEMWLGQATTYTVSPGNVTSSAVTVTSGSVWLIKPGDPTKSVIVDMLVDSFGQLTYDTDLTFSEVAGRATPVGVSSGTRKSESGTFTLYTQTVADLQALLNNGAGLLDTGQALLLNVPPSLGFNVPTDYIQAGNITVSRPQGNAFSLFRSIAVPYRVVSQPVGGAIPQKSYADVVATYTNYAAIAALGDYSKLL